MKIYALFVIFILNFTLFAQPKKVVSKTKPKPKPTSTPKVVEPKKDSETLNNPSINKEVSEPKIELPKFSEQLFDENNLQWTSIPKSYLGNDFSDIFNRFLVLFKPKDEFETTLDYQKRIEEGSKQTILGNITPNSQLGFINKFEESDLKYDADTQILAINLDIESIKNLKGIKTQKTDIQEIRKYEAQNGFGAKVIVTEAKMTKYAVAFNNIREFKSYLQNSDPNLSTYLQNNNLRFFINLSPDKAREAKSNLLYLLIFTPTNPYVGVNFEKLQPKFDFPYDASITTRYLQGKLSEIWLFNDVTGEIYQKVRYTAITSGNLKINSSIRNDAILLLDKSFIDILIDSKVTPIENTKLGLKYDLLITFFKAAKNPNAKKYAPFLEIIKPLVEKHTVKLMQTDQFGGSKIENLKFGKYYIFAGASDYFGTYIWDMPIEVNEEVNDVYLSSSNATYK